MISELVVLDLKKVAKTDLNPYIIGAFLDITLIKTV